MISFDENFNINQTWLPWLPWDNCYEISTGYIGLLHEFWNSQ